MRLHIITQSVTSLQYLTTVNSLDNRRSFTVPVNYVHYADRFHRVIIHINHICFEFCNGNVNYRFRVNQIILILKWGVFFFVFLHIYLWTFLFMWHKCVVSPQFLRENNIQKLKKKKLLKLLIFKFNTELLKSDAYDADRSGLTDEWWA